MKPITIIGGGLAGLALGIGLRRRGVPVTVVEAGHYPRHKVCGEFISGRGQATLERLGLLGRLTSAGATSADTVEFFTPTSVGGVRRLPQPALCLPRYEMDALFAAHFRELGGDLREGERRRDPSTDEGVVLATGRRLHPTVNGRHWFGLKVHARGVHLEADLEMHLSRFGYVGLCRQPGGVVNVCGLFRHGAKRAANPGDWREMLCGPQGSLLRDRMSGATFAENSFCAVAGIHLGSQHARLQDGCRVGDALTMIPPLTGNGMSIAFETAEAAINPLTEWSQGTIPWPDAQKTISLRCDELLSTRLRWAGWIQRAALSPMMQGALLKLTSRSDRLWRSFFERTR
ncbi:MAG TPA: FAD-dependent monooxygenase [Verrucomicrobiota bacterium]|nr:FAD-dependent monooxygenase [Verrucomicrobiota bacterium]